MKNTSNLAQQDGIIGRNPWECSKVNIRKSYARKNEAAWQRFTSYARPGSSAISDDPHETGHILLWNNSSLLI